MDALKDYIGFYEWEGIPCQIMRDPQDPDTLRAVAYHKGKGLTPIPLQRLLENGEMIPESRYKQMVMTMIQG